ncbi:L,D-transpeptidase [Limimaricola sp. G21655-S1]|uniref:L,D-transpeptidase n=1 Tax=Limimaricola sp. G21655-S1 TaxID=3014768 RepID=UPI0022AEDAA5|nr:L,D-transpeptidase [Limimaricola sp. G21655-S1]MCZ4259384.1 L,D-transpeptidase [Limimaricola sp. G21655-S1]
MKLSRRGVLAAAAAIVATGPVLAAPPRVVKIPREWLPTEISVNEALAPGQVHVRIAQNRLYWTLGNGRAIRYVVALGAAGRNFTGTAQVARKAEWPAWTPTANMIRQEPAVYGPYAGGLPGGHARNPLGSRALYLYQNGRDTYYRIHGTPQPWTMGRKFSSGCVRLINEHVEDLYDRVPVGTTVVVI